jgi:hypothetical protein
MSPDPRYSTVDVDRILAEMDPNDRARIEWAATKLIDEVKYRNPRVNIGPTSALECIIRMLMVCGDGIIRKEAR